MIIWIKCSEFFDNIFFIFWTPLMPLRINNSKELEFVKKIAPGYGAMVRTFRLISNTFGSIFSYGTFAEFLQMGAGPLGSWGIGVAHICTRLDVSPSIHKGSDGRPLTWRFYIFFEFMKKGVDTLLIVL